MTFDPCYVSAALAAAKTRTWQAGACARLSHADRDDLHQELLLDLLPRGFVEASHVECKFCPYAGPERSVWGSEDWLAMRFTRRYQHDLRYVALWGKWLVWDGQRWRPEETLAATDLIRQVCRHAALRAASNRVAARLAASSTDDNEADALALLHWALAQGV